MRVALHVSCTACSVPLPDRHYLELPADPLGDRSRRLEGGRWQTSPARALARYRIIAPWVFLAPIGPFNAPRSMGKSLMADPERAPLVRRAFEEYKKSPTLY